MISARPPNVFLDGRHGVKRLIPDYRVQEREYFRKSGIFPIMHAVGVRRTLVERHPWLPAAVLKAFEQAKAIGMTKLADTSAPKVTLPFVAEQLKAAQDLMGNDFWSYGVASNRATLETFLRHHHKQGLSSRLVAIDELFHPATHEMAKV
jgi:4,5-dihydroxyphthalate decarboxylase